eukprot:10663699-Ditylum_brightwellii.AAC.1
MEICLTACWEDIANQVYTQVFPNFATDPAAIVQGIHEEYMNPKDNSEKITLTVELYFKAIQ